MTVLNIKKFIRHKIRCKFMNGNFNPEKIGFLKLDEVNFKNR